MKESTDTAFLIHARPYRDTSLIVDCLTREHGRIQAVARAARQGKSPQSRRLQPFQKLIIRWKGHSDLKTLTSTELDAAEPSIALMGEPLFCGFYLNELVWHLLHRYDPHEQLFDAYQETLKGLAKNPLAVEMEAILRHFELIFLNEIGYGFSFLIDGSGDLIRADLNYAYDVENGFYPELSGFSGELLQRIEQGKIDSPELLQLLKKLIRQQLDYRLNGRALKSRELLRQQRRRSSIGI